MLLETMIFRQLFIFFLYVVFSFGITSFFNKLFSKNKFMPFVFPSLLLILTLVLLVLGFLNYSLLAGLSFVGSLVASLVFLFFSDRE